MSAMSRIPARSRIVRVVLALAVGLLLTPAVPAGARKPHRAPFRGLGAWIDIYDDGLWNEPEVAVAALDGEGVRTLYLQTCNYNCKESLHRSPNMERFIHAAHASRIRVVAWYLPGFDNLHRDLARSRDALNFRTSLGQGFDGFALDIEARLVNPVGRRNRRIVDLSWKIRRAAGARSPLGAITPPWFYDWGGPFPYRALDPVYDAFLPMTYFSGRGEGPKIARRNTALDFEAIRRGTGDPRTAIHAIGGIADQLGRREVAAFANAAKRRGGIGVSLYDVATSEPEDWRGLAGWR
jgi:hypothetical protein